MQQFAKERVIKLKISQFFPQGKKAMFWSLIPECGVMHLVFDDLILLALDVHGSNEAKADLLVEKIESAVKLVKVNNHRSKMK